MAKVIDRADISLHQADALLFGDPEDLGDKAMEALDERYGRDPEGKSLLRRWHAHLVSRDDWIPGIIVDRLLGEKQDQLVIFCCVRNKGGKSELIHVRDSVRKLAKKAKGLNIKHIACGVLGRGDGNMKVVLLDPIVSSALDTNLQVTIYDKFEKGKVPE